MSDEKEEYEQEGPAPNVLADSAAYIYNSFSDVDTMVLSKEEAAKIKDLRKWAIHVAHHYMKQIYKGTLPE